LPTESDRNEFLAMVDAHGPAIFAMLRRLCRNVHDAEDAFQNTAVRVWRNIGARPLLRNPRAWLMTIAFRTFVDLKARKPQVHALVDVPDPRVRSPDNQAEQSDEFDQLGSAMNDLPDALRHVLILHYTGGLTIRQTAQALDVSDGTVKSRLNAALTKLRSVLQ
jgi:RNA polymerase sigma-70 factor (ECF subfamily)